MMKINIGIPEEERSAISESLKKLLADTYTLYQKTHSYHWNVTGPMFQTLHILFMTQYTELWNAIDPIAERIRSLGYYAPMGGWEFAKYSSIAEDKEVPKAQDMIKHLVEGNEAVIRTARAAYAPAEKGNDQATLDLLTQRLDIHEKTAWMLRSLLED
ncbi:MULTISPECIES: Dps family protein [Leptospira]|nr:MULTISPECIES: Dps family protein [Leptospira]MCG6141967.1 DNA starvation/stationary phase protection protein [Leptospira mtsangambouensis]MCG6145854.1 DNA starvation/stationary phase protection protein [Leptospira bandrabouensis]MCG6153417.1 DNA starvation/stationary phase protection protein [Leptospira bandrabouensis]MCG6165441.1 DNA starvation/stationary phase protection protein [Leptospira bandrabouensis]MCW7460241.1 DNA starvation/stationary phase protection protein [Leptospira bandrabo